MSVCLKKLLGFDYNKILMIYEYHNNRFAILEFKNIPHRIFRHSGPIHSLEQAARERGQMPDQIVRSIVFRIGKEDYIMVLVAGPDQVSWPALRKYLGLSRSDDGQ